MQQAKINTRLCISLQLSHYFEFMHLLKSLDLCTGARVNSYYMYTGPHLLPVYQLDLLEEHVKFPHFVNVVFHHSRENISN